MPLIYFLVLFLYLFPVRLFAQDKILTKKKLETEANNLFSKKLYSEALSYYLKIDSLERTSPEINYKIGICYLNSGSKNSAVPHLKNASDSDKMPNDIWYYLGQAHHYTHQFDEAVKAYEKYKNLLVAPDPNILEISRQIELCKYGKIHIQKASEIPIKNLSRINSPYKDYSPLLSSNENILFFISERDEFNIPTIYVANKKNEEWSNPQPLLDTKDFSDTSLKQQIFFLDIENDIYSLTYEKGEWSQLVKLKSDVNTIFIDNSACISSDKNTLYFVSDRPGGQGGKDIYKSIRLPNGEWALSQNLGLAINTIDDEETPFISKDGKTLYFSSKGYNSMGGFDIYKSTFDESDSTWSKPQNVGFPINSASDETGYIVSKDGRHGYFISDRDKGIGTTDIYSVDLRGPTIAFAVIKGNIFENNPLKRPISAKITLVDKYTKEVLAVYSTSDSLGKYILIAPTDAQYDLVIEPSKAFLPHLVDLYIPSQTKLYELHQEVYLEFTYSGQLLEGQKIILWNAFFNMDDAIKINPSIAQLGQSKAGLETYLNYLDEKEFPLNKFERLYNYGNDRNANLLSYTMGEEVVDVIPPPHLVALKKETTKKDDLVNKKVIIPIEKNVTPVKEPKKIPPIEIKPPIEAKKEEIVFKIQLKALPKADTSNISIFENIKNVTTEETNTGYIRYLTGSFFTYTDAALHKEKISKEGFADAFIVAYKENQRISITENMKSGYAKVIQSSSLETNKINSSDSAIITPFTSKQSDSLLITDSKTLPAEKKVDISPTTSLINSITKEVIYRVQLKAIPSTESSSIFKEINDITKESIPSGLTRYMAGTFDSYEQASLYRDSISKKGFDDAFVVAYKEGKRIQIKDKPISVKTNAIVNSQTKISENNTINIPSSKNIIFKVQLGIFKDAVPTEVLNNILTIKNVKQETIADGAVRYTSGSFRSYTEAQTHKEEIIKSGITGAFIIAYNNGILISVKEALELLKK